MAHNVYEGMFILDSNHYARDPGGTSGRVTAMIEKHGGELLASRLWNEQKLAYPINGHRKGTYWLTYFRLESGRLADLNAAVRLEDSVLRSLVLKIEPRLVEAMVAHATGEAQESESGEQEEEGSKDKEKTPAAAAEKSD